MASQWTHSPRPAGPGAVALTSIAAPTDVMRRIASDARARDMRFFVIGDTKNPADFALDGCDYHGVDAQVASGSRFARLRPTRHYARKNFGYLLAMGEGVDFIVETDDDNMPSDDFYTPLPREMDVACVEGSGWTNVYRYYTDRLIWPRGLPLDAIHPELPPLSEPKAVRVRFSRVWPTRTRRSTRSTASSRRCRSTSTAVFASLSATARGARTTARTRSRTAGRSRCCISPLSAASA